MTRIYVATRKGLFTIERTAAGACPWRITRTAFLGDHVSMVLPDGSDGSAVAALDHGHFGAKLHRSHDAGQTWQESAAPEYPPKPEGLDDRNVMMQTPLPWRLMKVWALERGSATDPSALWCGTIPGGLFHSADGGESWEIVRSLWDHPLRKEWFGGGAEYPGIHSICVNPRDNRNVAVGVSCGGVWITPDGGENWECRARGIWAAYMPPERKDDPFIQDVHRVVRCDANPDCYWAQHHNGVFRTTDGANSWHEVKDIQPSNFGFAVAVHPRDPNTAWLVPAIKDERRIPVDGKVVVTRTRDGGRSFEPLRKGLPQEHAYDLVYRHGLDIDPSGERLVMGSTTGSLWISEDQGDSWLTVSEHLPPIYCVRFVQ